MTEEIQNTEVEVAVDPVESRARSQGWVPLEEWDGDPNDWVDARTFNLRGELFDKIKHQRKELDDLRLTVSHMVEHNKKIAQLEYEKALKELKRQKAEALDSGDHTMVVEIDDQIAELKSNTKEKVDQQQVNQGAVDPREIQDAYNKWIQDNDWYLKHQDMQQDAAIIGAGYKQANPQASVMEVFEYVSKKIKRMYPERFTNTNRTKHSTVSGTTTTTAPKNGKKFSMKDLSEEQQKVARVLEKRGDMTVEKYIEQLAQLGELG